MTAPMFPFSAVVGQDDAKLALTLAAAEPALGGVLLRGHKGSAKTTLARALASLLPGEGRFVELPVGATEDRVVGSVDLAAALTGGKIRFRPGLLAAAHGGVLYVDEINLLADHLVDVLLDVAVSGINRVEREGISHTHPSRFVLVGSMNPEEGDLRPQLLDRFGLAVDVTTETDPSQRAEAVRRRMAFDANPESFRAQWSPSESELGEHITRSARASLDDAIIGAVSRLCASVGAEGLRADLVICRAAAALAGLEGRTSTTSDDVRRVAPLALAHRRRRHPLDPPGISPEELDSALGSVDSVTDPANGQGAPAPVPDHVADPGPMTAPPRLQAGRAENGAAGRRSVVHGDRGRLVGDRAPDGAALGSVAVGATLRAAAVRRSGEPGSAVTDAIQLVQAVDVREAVRETRAGNLVVFAVDASGSMGAERRMEAAKGAVLGLLVDAYQRRDKVALVTFRGDGAEVVLRPTGSVEVAKARLADVPTGGGTPLAAGIDAALDLALAADRQNGEAGHRPLLVLVSDGRATKAPPGTDPLEAARDSAASVRRRRIPAVVIDAEEGRSRLGLAAELAELMGARYLTLGELSVVGLRGATDGSG